MESARDEGPWAAFRQDMPVARQWAYLDHAAVAPLPGPTRTAIEAWVAEACEAGDTRWPGWAEGVERVRRTAARLIGAQPDEIAFVSNTTTGIGLVAEGFPWQAGDNVVTLANEFPSNVYPWLNLASRGVETRRVEAPDGRADLDQLLAACDRRTRIVAVSWVGYATGWRLDLNELVRRVHDAGAWVFIDGIQGLGVFPLDVSVTGIDFLAADGHKWMLGPEGAGLLYIRREHLDRLRPLLVGWHSVVHAHDYDRIAVDWRPAAARYEGGSANMAGILGLGASLDTLERYGLGALSDTVAQRVWSVCRSARDRLAAIGARIVSSSEPSHASGIVSFELPGCDHLALKRRLLQQGVVLSCRSGRLRISPHAYNNDEDLERLVAGLRSAPKDG